MKDKKFLTEYLERYKVALLENDVSDTIIEMKKLYSRPKWKGESDYSREWRRRRWRAMFR